jgi:hypothetical protein
VRFRFVGLLCMLWARPVAPLLAAYLASRAPRTTVLATPRTGYRILERISIPDPLDLFDDITVEPPQRTEGGTVTTYFPKYPAVDGLLDLLFQYGLPASSIHTRTQHGRVTLSVALPHGTYTDEYTASSIQGAARNWLNGEADEFHELLILDAQTHARAAA